MPTDMEILDSVDSTEIPDIEDTGNTETEEDTTSDSGPTDEVVDDGGESEESTGEDESSETDLEAKGKAAESTEEEIDPEGKVAGRLTYKDITSKYPKLFKDFPQLRHAFFREQKYAEHFPTVEDAEEASAKTQVFNAIESELQQGKPELILRAVTGMGKLEQFAEQLLPSIYQTNKDAFYRITQPILQDALFAAAQEGSKSGNKNLYLATQHLAQFLFGTPEVVSSRDSRVQQKQEDPEKIQLQREKAQFFQNKAIEFEQGVAREAHSLLFREILDGLDPNNSLSEFTRKSMVREIYEQVGSELTKDSRHIATMNSLWKRANQTGLNPEMKERLVQAYIARAKELIPVIKGRVRQSASGKKVEAKSSPKRMSGNAAVTKTGAVPSNPKQIDWKSTSDLDILSGKANLRK